MERWIVALFSEMKLKAICVADSEKEAREIAKALKWERVLIWKVEELE